MYESFLYIVNLQQSNFKTLNCSRFNLNFHGTMIREIAGALILSKKNGCVTEKWSSTNLLNRAEIVQTKLACKFEGRFLKIS